MKFVEKVIVERYVEIEKGVFIDFEDFEDAMCNLFIGNNVYIDDICLCSWLQENKAIYANDRYGTWYRTDEFYPIWEEIKYE